MKNILKVSPLSDDISVQRNNSYFKLNLIFEVDLNIASSMQCQFFDWQKQELRKEQENAIKQEGT